jgi:hypothetical protein
MGLTAHAGAETPFHNRLWSPRLTLHLPTVLTEIRSLLDEPAVRARVARASVEKTLTDGYAHALALEGERLRVERRLRAIVRDSDRAETTDAEVASLASSVAVLDRKLADLRGLLAELRAHAL